MQKALGIGFVGAGGIVRTRHLPNLQNIEGVRLVSVCNRSQESSERIAQEFGLRKVYTDWQELVQDKDIDIVWIGTWPYLHCPITLAALQAGKHVFCQARMAMNLHEAHAMRSAAQKSGKVTMLCPPPMGLKGDNVMRKLIRDEVLGRIYSIHFRDINGSLHDPQSSIHWRQQSEYSGHNALTVGIYAEIMQRWFGDAKSIIAEAKTFIPMRPSGDGKTVPVDRPDVVMALSEMESGALMRWEWSALSSADPVSMVEIFGSRGSAIYDFRDDHIYLAMQGQSWDTLPISPEEERSWTVERDFIRAIREGIAVHPDFEDGVKYMEFTQALFQSVKQGKRVFFPLSDLGVDAKYVSRYEF